MGKVNLQGSNGPSKQLVTPGGLRAASDVHYIEPGHHISGLKGIFKKVQTATGEVVREFGKINKAGLTTRDLLRGSGAQELEAVAARVPITDQWITYSGWTNQTGLPISYFSTDWQVPPAPASNHNQLIYLFNGIENAANNVILQPVLQWGVSPIGGGPWWAVANWYVGAPGSGLAFHGPLVRVNEGDNLVGIMSLTGNDGGLFNYLSSFTGINADLDVRDVGELVWAVETLECYGLKAFSDYPATQQTAMSAIEIKVGDNEAPLAWDAYNAVTDNGQHTEIASNASPGGAVNLYYS